MIDALDTEVPIAALDAAFGNIAHVDLLEGGGAVVALNHLWFELSLIYYNSVLN
jgi:hypothetical protein